MNCEHELEIVSALMDGRWPEGCDPSLTAHTASCALCAELLTVAGAVRNEHQLALQEAAPPPSGLVWWRAQRRARQEALATASRAITTVQATTVSLAAAIALTVIGFTRETWLGWVGRMSDVLYFGGYDLPPSTTLMLGIAFAATVLLAPVAVWLAVSHD
jgi:predicted anti-sigma-YlaC factor YlaD